MAKRFIEDEEGMTLLFSRRQKDAAFAAAELILHSCDVKATVLRCRDPETGAPAWRIQLHVSEADVPPATMAHVLDLCRITLTG